MAAYIPKLHYRVIFAVLFGPIAHISDGVSIEPAIKPILTKAGDTAVTLPCDFSTATYETPQITWYQTKDGERRKIMQFDIQNHLSSYGEFENRVARGDRGALVLLRPRSADSSNFSCEVEVDNEIPSFVKTTMELLVTEEPLATTEGSTEQTPRYPDTHLEDWKRGLIVFIAFLWVLPLFSWFLLGKKGFELCEETCSSLQTKTARQLLPSVFYPVAVVIASCLILVAIVCTAVALSSTSPDVTNRCREAGLALGILGIFGLLLSVLRLFLYSYRLIPCKKKAPVKQSEIPDVMESEITEASKATRSKHDLHAAEVTIPSTSRRSTGSDAKRSPEQTVSLMPQKSIEKEKPEQKLTIHVFENPSNDKVVGMAAMSQKQVYILARTAVYQMDISTGKVISEHTQKTDQKDDFLMATKYKTDLIIMTRDRTSKKFKTQLFHMQLAKQKFYKIDLQSKSTPTWVVTGKDGENFYLTMSNPAGVVRRTLGKKHEMCFGEGVLKKPTCIVQNSSNHLIIADPHKNDLLVFDENGDFVTSIRISVPRDLVVEMKGCDRLAIAPDDRIYATSPSSKNILVFSPDFRFERLLPTRAEGGGAISCLMVHNDSLYVAHEDCIRVHSGATLVHR